MTALKANTVCKALQKKCFVIKSGRNNHLRFVFCTKEGLKTRVTTYMSHNHQDIDDYLVKNMAAQVRLSKSEFAEMVSCSLGYDELIKLYEEQGLVSSDGR
jgi:hypothetical protein